MNIFKKKTFGFYRLSAGTTCIKEFFLMRKPYLQDKSLIKIACLVIFLHCCLLIFGIFVSPSKSIISQAIPTRLVVQTIKLSPPAVKVVNPIPPKAVKAVEEPVPVIEEEISEEEDVQEEISEAEEELVPVAPTKTKEFQEKEIEISANNSLKEEKPLPAQTDISPKTPQKKPLTKEEKKTIPKKNEIVKAVPKKSANPKIAKAAPVKGKILTSKVTKPTQSKISAPKDQKKTVAKKNEVAEKKNEVDQQAKKIRQQQLLAQAQEKIAKITQNRDKSTSKVSGGNISLSSLPKAITALHIDALPGTDLPQWNDREISYRDELASRLKLGLHLPEYGDVKVKMTLNRSGKIINIAVLSTESISNKKYVEKTLPALTFPSFGSNFGDAQEYTFSITLSNE